MKKIESIKRKNGYKSYPKTLVEAVFWDKEKKPLEEVLDGMYQKPKEGIPMTDLAEEVQKSLFSQPVGSEHVSVKVRGCVYDSDNGVDKAASVIGGKVVVKSWNPATAENYPTIELAIPSSGVVEFDIPHGLHYQVHSVKSGLGASFRLVFTSSVDDREVFLWNLSLGVYNFGFNALMYADGDSFARMVPVICADGAVDLSGLMDWDTDGTVYSDDGGYPTGILVSTADVSFLLGKGNKSESSVAWSKMNYGRSVPALEEYYETNGHDWDAAIAASKEDFDGPINTDKIVSVLAEAPAAYFCVSSGDYHSQRYLPSVGELNAIYLNKGQISVVNADAEITTDIDNSYYWSSCAFGRGGALYEGMGDGTVNDRNESHSGAVLAVSAFLYYH